MPYASNVSQSGQIILVGQGKIQGQFAYRFKPYVLGFLSNGSVVTDGAANSDLQIKGLYFGNSQGAVKFGILDGKISSWSDTSIDLTIPVPTTSDTNTIEICSSSGVCLSMNFLVRKQVFKDTLAGQQYYLSAIKYDSAYNTLVPSAPIVVAVLDEGIQLDHPDLKDSIWTNPKEISGDGIDNDKNGFVDDVHGYNFLDNNADLTVKGDHGTEVAGIIGAARNNNLGIAGIAPNAKLMSLIVCHSDGTCVGDAVLAGIKYAVDNGARIINLSLEAAIANEFDSGFNDVMKYAYDHNVVVVVAAGNGDTATGIGRNLTANQESPVCNDNGQNMVLGVGASNRTNDAKTDWTNYGNCVDVFSPGEGITTTDTTGDLYATVSGTSFATPIVSAVAAQILSAYPDMKNSVLINYIVKDGPFLDTEKLFNDIKATFNHTVVSSSTSGTGSGTGTVVPPTAGTGSSSVAVFSDVNKFNKNFRAITYLHDQGIISGYADGTFRPEQGVTRAEMLKILIKGGLGVTPGSEYGKACFKDVKASDWFSIYVCYAHAKGWTEGYADGTFQPNKQINKVEAIKFLALINNLPKSNLSFLPYVDVPTGAWYEIYLKEAFQMGLLEEINNLYEPDNSMTRGSISESIFRLILVRKFAVDKYTPDLLSKL
jgi:subtilisin family serine protease